MNSHNRCLVRTPDNYRFQLHSYGEYLAAEELSEIQETDRIIRLMYLDNTLCPSDSWRNCVSYLMEHCTAASERYSVASFLIGPSLRRRAVFDEKERTAIVRELLASLSRENVYLLHHPTIRVIPTRPFRA